MVNHTDYSRVPITAQKKILVALPLGMLEEIDRIAKAEYRTRSDLVREGLRRYIENFHRVQNPKLTLVGSEENASD